MAYLRGQSGNPAGRPKGAKNTSTVLRAKLSKGLPRILSKLTALALEGDTAAMKMVLDRVLPTLRPVSAAVQIPGAQSGDSLSATASAVLEAITSGQLPPDVGATIMASIAATARAVEIGEISRRLELLEADRVPE